MVHADAEYILVIRCAQVDVSHGLRVRAGVNSVFLVVHKGVPVHFQAVNGVKEGVDGAVTIAGDIEGVAVTLQRAGEGDLRVLILVALLEVALGEAVGAVELEVFPLKQVQNVGGLQLVTDVVALCLDDGAEFRMHGLGQIEAEVLGHDKSGAALAGLAVDADNGLVVPSYIGRVDGEIGDLPLAGFGLLHVLGPLVDGILMAAGEGGEHQFPYVGLTLPDVHFGDLLIDVADVVDVGEVQLGVNALGEHVQRDCDHVHVAGPLAVSK